MVLYVYEVLVYEVFVYGTVGLFTKCFIMKCLFMLCSIAITDDMHIYMYNPVYIHIHNVIFIFQCAVQCAVVYNMKLNTL